MNDRIDRELKFIRDREKLRGHSGVDPNYQTPWGKDVHTVKGSAPQAETVTRVKSATEHIDTKSPLKVGNAADVMKANAEKASRMKAMRKLGKGLPAMGAITALGSGLMSEDASASDIAQDIITELPGDVPVLGQVYDAIRPETSGPSQGSLDDRLEKGLLTPEEMELLRQMYMGDR